MNTSDTIFVSNPEFDTFKECWDAFLKLSSCIQHQTFDPVVESVRYSFKSNTGLNWFKKHQNDEHLKLTGWHYALPFQGSLENLQQQISDSIKSNHSFLISSDDFGKSDSIHCKLNLEKQLSIHIPFEDRVEHSKRYFSRFHTPWSKVLGVSLSKVNFEMDKFYDHCNQHYLEEKPFELNVSGLIPWKNQKTGFVLKPIKRSLGRHTLFDHLEITAPAPEKLYLLLTHMIQTLRPINAVFYFQFYTHPKDEVKFYIPNANLDEITFEHHPLSFSAAQSLVNDFNNEISDLFCVFEHKQSKHKNIQSVIYTLRKTLSGTFELRFNPYWDPSQENPEKGIAPISRSVGFDFDILG